MSEGDNPVLGSSQPARRKELQQHRHHTPPQSLGRVDSVPPEGGRAVGPGKV